MGKSAIGAGAFGGKSPKTHSLHTENLTRNRPQSYRKEQQTGGLPASTVWPNALKQVTKCKD